MNERILELEVEARKYAESKPDIYKVAYDKKFSELIIKEVIEQCVDFIENRAIEEFERTTLKGEYKSEALMSVVQEIKQHFGVKV